MATFESGGATLHYEEAGVGPALVFTHGAALDGRMWREQVERFADRYRVVAWDVRGHGRSTLPDGPVDPADYSADLVALLDRLGLRSAALCGLSMGGHISLQAAIRYPERVAALALIGTPCSNSFNWFERTCVPINRWWMEHLPINLSARMMAGSLLASPNAEAKAYLYEAMSSIPRERFGRLWRATTSMESRDRLGEVACPTLIMIGDKDKLTGRQQAFMRERIAGSRMVVIPGAGHATNLDNGAAVNAELDAFLSASYPGADRA